MICTTHDEDDAIYGHDGSHEMEYRSPFHNHKHSFTSFTSFVFIPHSTSLGARSTRPTIYLFIQLPIDKRQPTLYQHYNLYHYKTYLRFAGI